ncbi:MAG: Tn3 family transposase [Candidatus Wallbacteria bacterium]|nr:Tn3 family transposase [Candidatus Wallbacteria bacterium]
MAYPSLPAEPSTDYLRDQFILSRGEQEFLACARSDPHRLGLAVLLKSYQFLGYAPESRSAVPSGIIDWLAQRLEIAVSRFGQYPWNGRTGRHHLALVRAHLRCRPFEPVDAGNLQQHLVEVAHQSPDRRALLAAAVEWCRARGVELPREGVLRRVANAGGSQFFRELYRHVAGVFDPGAAQTLERCLLEPREEESREGGPTLFDWLKAPPGRLGMKTLLDEVEKLRWIRAVGLSRERCFPAVSDKVLALLRERARAENAGRMNRHPRPVRLTLLAALLLARQGEVTDQTVRTLLELIGRIEKRADRMIEKRFMRNLQKVLGKTRILYRIAAAATANPDGTVREVVYPAAGEEVLARLAAEAADEDLDFEVVRMQVVETKYRSHYRQMMKPVLDTLRFRADNPAHKPLLNGIELVRHYVDSKKSFYPEHESIPEKLLTGRWRALVMQPGPDGERAAKHAFEVCVLTKLERALKCKEVWVEGAYRFRNPVEDLPRDWETVRVEQYRRRGLPLEPVPFLEKVRQEMTAELETFHAYLGRAVRGADAVEVRHPGGGEAGVFHVPPLVRRPERPVLTELKGRVLERFGIHDLLDILVEADREVGFHRFFETSGQRQILSAQEARRRLLLVIFSLGTNLGLKRIHTAASPGCSYDDLRYFRDRYVTAPAVRRAIAALVNRILERRNPEIWGEGTVCASDSKQLGAWDQNLVAEWHPRYRTRGVMVYWHVATNAICIYSSLKTCSSSEVSAMIEGLVRHDTEMRVERNFVDSHGQSEVAFGFSRFLTFELMPRLKRIKHEKLYLPDKGLRSDFPRLAGVLTRPIDWSIIADQYDEMVRHVVAVADGTGPVESILRRFNSYNRSHPTYRAFAELGKALKTTFLCRYLREPALRQEVHEGLNVVENWNSIVDFLFFGRKSELATNDPEAQELGVLCLHLLQNALILVNTVMLERVLQEQRFAGRMETEDFRALTPLFTANVNPYGDFTLDLDRPSILEDAA